MDVNKLTIQTISNYKAKNIYKLIHCWALKQTANVTQMLAYIFLFLYLAE